MQGLADGYFVIPHTLGNYIGGEKPDDVSTDAPEFKQVEDEVNDRINQLLTIKGKRTVNSIHRELGQALWDHCGMARDKAGLEKVIEEIPRIREEFWNNVNVPGECDNLNQSLERAGRVADFLELGELIARDALQREESCGGHFRTEHQTEEGEALRNDEDFSYVAAWEWKNGDPPVMHKEELDYEEVEMSTRSYK
jgi:succinate dehydrogenase / fumarate reductase flavoprotein subunit